MVNNITITSSLEPLLYKHEWVHLAELSRILKTPHPTLRQHLNFFEKKGILSKSIKGRLTLYKIKEDAPLLLEYLVITEKNKLIARCNQELLLKEITYFFHSFSNTLLIFGSSVHNLKNANDIDLLITGEFNKQLLKDFEKRFGVKFHIISIKNLLDVSPTLKKEIIEKHLIINNSEEVIKWMLKN